MKRKVMNLVLLTLVLLASCKKENVPTPEDTLTDIQKIATIYGNQNSPTVVVNLQGGPLGELEDIQPMIDATGTQNALWVNVHQEQTKTPTILDTEMSFTVAKEKANESANYVNRVVNFYKKQGKKVCLVGISYGAFVAQDYIARYGTGNLYKAIIAAGRLDIEEPFWTNFSNGNDGRYVYDAAGNFTFNFTNITVVKDRNLYKLAAGLGYKRYTQLLSSVSGLNKVQYYYGTRDTNVGKLSATELSFLISKGIGVYEVPDGTHSDAAQAAGADFKSYFEII